jgi:hypothetical protein
MKSAAMAVLVFKMILAILTFGIILIPMGEIGK